MKISELIKILERLEDEHGDVWVERNNGAEAIGVACVFEKGKKDPKVIAVKVQ